MNQFNFLGLLSNFPDYRLQQLVTNDDGTNTDKKFDILCFVACEINGRCVYFPISNHDMDTLRTIDPYQILNLFADRTRRLVQKTDKGYRILPYGFIIP